MCIYIQRHVGGSEGVACLFLLQLQQSRTVFSLFPVSCRFFVWLEWFFCEVFSANFFLGVLIFSDCRVWCLMVDFNDNPCFYMLCWLWLFPKILPLCESGRVREVLCVNLFMGVCSGVCMRLWKWRLRRFCCFFFVWMWFPLEW